jgi:hypothetical protein
MSFQFRGKGGRALLDGDVEALFGQPALGHFRLLLNLKLHLFANGGEDLIDLAAQALIGGLPVGWFRALPSTSLGNLIGDTTTTVALEMELDRARLESIEGRRAGGNLELHLQLHATIAGSPGGSRREFQQVVHHVNQGVWISILEQMGYRRTLLLEVPMPDSQANPEILKAVESLAKAQGATMRGDYREAVGLCRDVMEAFGAALGDDDTKTVLPELFKGQRQMDKGQRQQLLRRALKVLTHPARHRDQSAAAIEWSRADALSTVTIAAALLFSSPDRASILAAAPTTARDG